MSRPTRPNQKQRGELNNTFIVSHASSGRVFHEIVTCDINIAFPRFDSHEVIEVTDNNDETDTTIIKTQYPL